MPLRSLEYDNNLQGFARSLRRNMTPQERKLWYLFLRSYPVKFYRQRIIGPYIVDFYCAKAKLAIELDGGQHFEDEGKRYDAQRDEVLSQYGIRVLRIPNTEIQENFAGVCEEILRRIEG